MNKVRTYILEQIASKNLSPEKGKEMLLEAHRNGDIAVIGMAGRFSNAANKEEFFKNIEEGLNCLQVFQPEREKYLKPLADNVQVRRFITGVDTMQGIQSNSYKAAYLNDIDCFDAAFFGIPPREASYMDPIQRVYLEVLSEVLEDAGYNGNKIKNTRTGVFVGRDNTSSTMFRMMVDADPMAYTGTWEGILASRLSYIYNLRGPAMVLDTACSSGLVSIHTAIEYIRSGQCDMALAGGIALASTPQNPPGDSDNVLGNVQSAADELRPFDKFSDGTIFGEGAGAVMLKPLEQAILDRDNIYAVIKGSAANNDGSSNGITAPSPEAQEDVYRRAWEAAGVDPETITLIEAHGTGTALGDPIEVKSLTAAFEQYTDKKQFCGIGTVKASIGHTVGASGTAGLMKMVHCLQKKKKYGTLNFTQPNPHINFIDSPIYMCAQTEDWDCEKEARRGAVSSFGFSGTNVHMVLEEYEMPQAEKHTGIQLFVLSAKSETALMNTIAAHHKFYIENPKLDLACVCYTMSCGRGHYNYRMALTADSLKDLTDKLAMVCEKGLKTAAEQGIYYDVHKIVSGRKQDNTPGELTSAKKIEISRQAERMLLNEDWEASIHKIAGLYVTGAEIDWKPFFGGMDVFTLSLPAYRYDRTIYWGNLKDTKSFENQLWSETIEDDYVKKMLLESVNQDVYLADFSTEDHWVIREHCILGKTMMPGAGYPELFRRIAGRYFKDTLIELRNVIFYMPLIVEEGEIQHVQIIVNKKEEYLEITVVTDMETEEGRVWKTHCGCLVYPFLPESFPKLDIQAIVSRTENPFAPLKQNDDAIIEKRENNRVRFGPRWNVVKRNIQSGAEMITDLELDEEFSEDLVKHKIHASLLDFALNITMTLEAGNGLSLPFSIKSLKCYRPMPRKIISYGILQEEKNKTGETSTLDVFLLDEEGNVCIKADTYTTKCIRRIEDVVGDEDAFYKTSWTKFNKEIGRPVLHPGNALILNGNQKLSNAIEKQFKEINRKAYICTFGDGYDRLDEMHYMIDGRPESYQEMLGQLKDKDISYVFFLSASNSDVKANQPDQFLQQQKESTDSLFLLLNGMSKIGLADPVDFYCITQNGTKVHTEDITQPFEYALHGILKCAMFEFPSVHFHLLDADVKTAPGTIFSTALGAEMPEKAAVRDGQVYIEKLERTHLKKSGNNQNELPADGDVIVITGGTGGMGSVIARWLSKQAKVKICLIGRSSMECRPDQNGSGFERLLWEITETGSSVQYYQGDAGSYASLKTVLHTIRKEHGAVHGIFHCAGIAGDGFIMNKSYDEFQSVLRAKVTGTWSLDGLTAEDPLKFFVIASSMAALAGAPGQSDYCAANSFIDAYITSKRSSRNPICCINWSGWSEAGMAVNRNLDVKQALFSPVDNQKAIHIIEECLSHQASNIITGQLNTEMAAMLDLAAKFEMVPKQVKMIEAAKRALNAKTEKKRLTESDISLLGKKQEEFTQTEEKVGKIFGMVLAFPEIDIYDTINDMGADSIMVTQLYKVINQQIPGVIDVADIFTYSSVFELSEYIDVRMGKSADKKKDSVEELARNIMADPSAIEKLIQSA